MKKNIANQNAYKLPFREFLLLLFFFFMKNERKMSLHLHVSKKSRVVGKYKGGFLGIDLSLLWKRLDLRVVIVHTVRKRFS